MDHSHNKINTGSFDTSGNILKFLTPNQLNYLNEIRHVVKFNKGENIFKQGAPMPHIIVLEKGMAKVFLEDGANRSIVLRLVKSGEILGGPGFFTDYKHHFSVTALEDSVAHFIEISVFKKLIQDNSDFAIVLIAYLNKAHINFYNRLKVISHKQMNGRLANTLIYLSNTIYNSSSFDTNLTRQDLADMSSMTKESAIRILKDFKSSGIIECSNNHFEINDQEALANILENG